jgi:hypothetical protein
MKIFKVSDEKRLNRIDKQEKRVTDRYDRRIDKYNSGKSIYEAPGGESAKPVVGPKDAARMRDKRLSRLSWKKEKVEKGY